MKMDYFEIDRVIEQLARTYAAPCTTTWFKVTNNKKPSKEEYRNKVVEFMKNLENTLLSYYPQNQESDIFREYAKKGLRQEIYMILAGDNKDVERRHSYYVDYN
ncbi:MAG TPA: hypothetical protein VFY64_06200 [Nitrososphaeraceae archaeon]|nr:hypothetical protein [Nitrososphaeraceae archaeon]